MFEDPLPKKFISPRVKTGLIVGGAFILGFGAHVFASFLPKGVWNEVKNVLTYSPQGTINVAEMDLNSAPAQNTAVATSVPLKNPTHKKISPAAKKKIKSLSHISSIKISGSSVSATLAASVADVIKKTSAVPQCKFKTSGKPRGDVILNEVAWMGSEDDANSEWLEIKNISGDWVDISGWQILNKDGKLKIALSDKQLAPEGIYILERGSDDTLPDIVADQIYSGTLSNSGEWLKLFDANCLLRDEIKAEDRWPAGSNVTKKTMERKVGADGWQTSLAVGGTPGAQNSVPATNLSFGLSASVIQSVEQPISQATPPPPGEENPPPTGANQLDHAIIAAVQTTGGAGLAENDFIKIYNPTAANLDVSGWKLRKRTKSGTESSLKVLANGSTLGPGEYFVWANSKYPAGANATSTATIASDNSVALFNADDQIIDAVAWGSDLINPFKEGSAFPQNPEAPQILKRKFISGAPKDDNDNASDFSLE